jgi:hypothetical protein
MIYDEGIFGVILPYGLYYQSGEIYKHVGYANIIEASGSGVFSAINANICFIKNFGEIILWDTAFHSKINSGSFIESGENLKPIVVGSMFKHYTKTGGTYYVCTFESGIVTNIEMINLPGDLIRSRDNSIFATDGSNVYKRNGDNTWTSVISDGLHPDSLIQLVGSNYYYMNPLAIYRNGSLLIGFTSQIYDFYISSGGESVVLTSGGAVHFLDAGFNVTHVVETGGQISSHSQLSIQGEFVAVNFVNKIVIIRNHSLFVDIEINSGTIALLPNF